MPLQLRRRNGSVTPCRNSEYLPFYYFIPKSILKKCGAELNAVPRNPREIFSNRKVCEFIESDLFLLLIIDAAAYLVWPHMGHKEYMEVYSGYDPAWKLAHCPDYWIKELTDAKILPTANDLYKMADTAFGYVSEEEIGAHLQYIVPQAMERYNMNAAIAVAEEFRCFEDFDLRKSRQKTDFYRKWYHTRTKHPIVSLEELKENYAESHNGQEWEEPDSGIDIEEAVTSQVLVDQFKATLSDKDMAILRMRMEGKTLEEIAKKLGYQNHSGVLKRIRKIGLAYEKFTGIDYGFENRKII